MKTRIIFTCQHSMSYGGVQHSMLDTVRHIDRTIYEPIVLCAPEGGLAEMLEKSNTRVHPMGRGTYLRYSFSQPLGTFKDLYQVSQEIVRLAREENARVVHAFDGAVFFAACLAKLQCKDLKVIWQDSGFNLYKLHFRLVMKWCFQHAARVTTITRVRQRQLLEEGLDPAKSAVVPNGTDFHLRPIEPFASPGAANGQRTIQVGIVGRIVPIKNFELFLQAARLVADDNPRVQFVIVGRAGEFSDEVEYYHSIRNLAVTLGLDDCVSFLEPIEDLQRLLNSFDVLVSSSHLETFGRTLIEAMALSKPVVATAVGGVPEVVSDSESGFLVPAGDARAMADKISILINNANLREEMGRKGYERVEKYFDIRLVAQTWERMYQELLRS